MAEFRSPVAPDEAVISTNDEATCSKKHAVSLGYWRDPYISLLCKQTVKKTPEISRGYFARVIAVRALVEQFIKSHNCECQVISLGAGYDTMYWNLKSSNLCPKKYVELDFTPVTRQKTHIIHSRKTELLATLGEDVDLLSGKLGLKSSCYSLMPVDLRNTRKMDETFKSIMVDFSLPTLLLTECVLMYMDQESTDKLLKYLSQTFQDAHFINYDVINMSDKFAEVMLSNLGSRQCALHTRDAQSKQTQIDSLKYSIGKHYGLLRPWHSVVGATNMFVRSGWSKCEVHDMNEIYQSIPQSERSRRDWPSFRNPERD